MSNIEKLFRIPTVYKNNYVPSITQARFDKNKSVVPLNITQVSSEKNLTKDLLSIKKLNIINKNIVSKSDEKEEYMPDKTIIQSSDEDSIKQSLMESKDENSITHQSMQEISINKSYLNSGEINKEYQINKINNFLKNNKNPMINLLDDASKISDNISNKSAVKQEIYVDKSYLNSGEINKEYQINKINNFLKNNKNSIINLEDNISKTNDILTNKSVIKQENLIDPLDLIKKSSRDINSPKIQKLSNKKNKKSFCWEYGNTGIKISKFNKIMCNNLAILHYINKIFEDYFLVNDTNTSIYDFYDSYGNKFISEHGTMYSKKNNIVNINLLNSKLNGIYNIIAAGRTTISNIIIDNDNKDFLSDIDLENITNIDNINNLINILSIIKYDITNNCSDENFSIDIFIKSISDIININPANLLKSNNTSAFYIKIYETYGKAFVIDYKNKLIYYIHEKEIIEEEKIYFNYYILKIDNSLKIKKI